MSDIQFVMLLATIILCTAYLAQVVYNNAKIVCEHVSRAIDSGQPRRT